MESKHSLISQWIEQGVLKKEQAEEILSSLNILPDRLHWRIFIENLLMWLGGLSLSFAMMFFIAYNWDAMGRFAKFALVEASIILCVIAYWKLDVNEVTAKVSFTAATILLGVLLALYGQTYQTGADPWQLFFNWALLMLPWAFVAHFASIWLIWIVLLNLSIVLYFQVRGGLFGLIFSQTEDVFWVLFIFNSLVWIAWELAATKLSWLKERWPLWLIAITSGFSISFLMMSAIFDQYSSETVAVFLYFIWAFALYFVYRKVIPDLFMLAGLCLSSIVVIISFIARHIFKNNNEIGAFFILTILVIVMSAGAAKWLKNVQKEMAS
ncbi:MAG: DUF2157 domain-containing protein [Gammaproteobacteria bacterium]|nr:DUF2157 domain-containing protein [Gammaproteobacteria bacterium]